MVQKESFRSDVGIPRVVFDPGSDYSWGQLSESEFLFDVLSQLVQTLGPAASEHSIHVFSTHDPLSLPALAREQSSRRRVLVRISDESGSIPRHLNNFYAHVFTTYLPHDLPDRDRMHAFPLGYANGVPGDRGAAITSRPTKVFFSGNLNSARHNLYRATHPLLQMVSPAFAGRLVGLIRKRIPSLIRRDLSEASRGEILLFSDRFRGGMTPVEYARHLAESRVVLCPAGFKHPETFRHYEALRAGAVVVTEPLPDTILYRGAPFITATDWVSGLREARLLADDLDRLIEMQTASQRHYERVLSPVATAERMARIILA
jgi:hypothetical protein